MRAPGDETDSSVTVDCYLAVEGTTVWSRQQRVLDALDRLSEAGRIERYRTQVWATRVPLSGPLADTRFYREAVKRVREFEKWADDRDCEVELPFERTELVSEFTRERHHVVRLPATCLTVYEGTELAGVFPCVVEGDCRSVPEFLSVVEDQPRETTERAVTALEAAPTR
jgi:hypothetical protein